MWPVWYNAPINVKPQVHRRHGLSFTHHQLAWEFLSYTSMSSLACSCTAQLNQTLHSVICDLQPCHVAIRLIAQIYMYQKVFVPSLSLHANALTLVSCSTRGHSSWKIQMQSFKSYGKWSVQASKQASIARTRVHAMQSYQCGARSGSPQVSINVKLSHY